MLRCCFGKKRPTPLTKEELDADLGVYMKNAPLVTGRPISAIKKKVSTKKIPVSVDTDCSKLMNLVEKGWCTDGETVQLNGRAHIWYTLEEETIPSRSDEDMRSQYEWKRIIIELELCQHQAEGWMARSYCQGTNRLWVCRRKKHTLMEKLK